jgi:hypothetical protein
MPELPPDDPFEVIDLSPPPRKLEPDEPMELPWAIPDALKRKIEELRRGETR